MPSYHFPIIVGDQQNERIVMVHLFDTPTPENYKESRVVFTQCIDPFFKVPKIFLLVSDTGQPVESKLVVSTKKQNTEENSVYVAGEQNQKKLLLKCVNHKNDKDYKKCSAIKRLEKIENETVEKEIARGEIIRLTFKCKVKNTEYEGNLHMVYCPDYEISYTNIDLGSDVTQVSRYKGNRFPVAKPLVDLFKGEINYTGPSSYLSQYCDNNKAFYRTGNILFKNGGKLTGDYINYLSLNLEGLNHYSKNTSDKRELGELGEEKKNENTTNTEVKYMGPEDYKTYPNIKVLYKMGEGGGFDGVFPFKRDDDELVPIDANSFFEVMAEIYKKLIQITADAKDRFHSVLLLVPNIYSQLQVDELVYRMSCAMNGDLAKATNSTKYYDFRAISESDAAFWGNIKNLDINWTDDLRDDLFLMIDSGRGTTDYSLISRSDENGFAAVRRGGIVGAGGAIDCVFAYIYAKHLYENCVELKLSKADFQKRFMIWLSNLPSGPKEKIRLEIENLKIGFKFEKRKNKASAYWKKSFISEEAIDNIVGSNYDQQDKHNLNPFSKKFSEDVLGFDEEDICLISRFCSIIAERTLNSLRNQENSQYLDAVDYVAYTGRAFDFRPLKDAFERKMRVLRFWRALPSIPANLCLRHLRGRHPKNSKNNTVRFNSHNLNINLNSDICCLQDLMRDADLNDRTKRFFTKEMLFNGYRDGNGNTTFYLGYFGTDSVWGGEVGQIQAHFEETLSDVEIALTIMTLYPNAKFNSRGYDSIMNLLGKVEAPIPKRILRKVGKSAKKHVESWLKDDNDKTTDNSTDDKTEIE